MNSVTAATCEYGLAKTNDGCARTLASYAHDGYVRLQFLFIGFGLLALLASTYKYVRSVHNNGAKLQQRAFLLNIYCSVTFLVRGVDPGSYGHYIPRPIGHFIVDSCTAAQYTIFIMTIAFWVSIIQKGVPTPASKASRVQLIEYSSIAAMWVFKIAINVSLFLNKGFDFGISSIELFATAAVLLTIGGTFLFYGLRVMRRLEEIDTMNARRLSFESQFESLHTSRTNPFTLSLSSTTQSTSCDPESGEPLDVAMLAPPPKKTCERLVPRVPVLKRKPAQKIREMLIVTESVTVMCIAAQIFTGIQRLDGYVELRCANGFECDKITVRFPLLHSIQYIAIWCVLFSFRKTKRNRNAANDIGLPQPVQLA